MVSEYKPLKKEDLHIDETTKNLRVDVESGISGQTVIAEISGQVVDVSDREVRKLGAIYGADAGLVVRIPLVDASRYVHTVVESGKVDVVVTSGLVVSKVSGETVLAKISGELVRTDISGQVVDVSDRSGREIGTVDVRTLNWDLALGTFWSGNIVNPGDSVAIGVAPFTCNTLYIKSHSGEMTFRVSLHDGLEYMIMEDKSFSGDMIWTIEHVTPTINLQTLSSGMVTARVYSARW